MNEGVELIVGKTVARVEQSEEHILLVCGDEAFRAYHMQDCCEYVRIYQIDGDLQQLVGKTITAANSEVFEDRNPPDIDYQSPECFTWTIHTFTAGDTQVKVTWLGESNGYYGEGVYFQRTHVPI